MIKDKLIPLGITFTIIAGAVGCDIANDKPIEETPVVEKEVCNMKDRVVRPTKIQSLYLDIELGSKFDENLFTGLEFLGERGTRSSSNGGYLIYAFGTEDEYIEDTITLEGNDWTFKQHQKIETMPTEERGSIGMIKPTGWHTIRYDGIIEDKYLYNRCHLIAYSLSGENANELNLITGTRYLNVSGMLPYEIKTADYIEETHNHVLYRVTPIFDGDNLLASGVLMEAKSVEDNGAGLQFNIYAYNIQPGILIDYCDG